MDKENLKLCYSDLTLRASGLNGQNWKVTFYTIFLFAVLMGLDIAGVISGIDPAKLNFYRFILVLVLVLVMEFGVNILLISTSELIRVKKRIQICRNLFGEEVIEFLDDQKQYEKWYNQYNILFQIITIIFFAILLLLHLFGIFV